MTLGDFLNNLAKTAGIDATNPALVSILSNADVATAKLDEGFAKQLTSGFLTFEAAKNNPELKSYYTALALNPLDTQFKELATEFELPDDVRTELESEKSSYKRVAMFTRKIKELEAKKAQANNGDKTKFTEQINNLNEQISKIKNDFLAEKSQLIEAHKADRVNWELDSLYSSFEFATPMSKEANIQMAKILVSEELKKNNLKIENVDNRLRLATNEGTDYYMDNQKVDIKNFMEKTLATNKVLKIDTQAPSPTPAGAGIKHPEKPTAAYNKVDAMLNEALGDTQP